LREYVVSAFDAIGVDNEVSEATNFLEQQARLSANRRMPFTHRQYLGEE
jgi:hypothetical protein